MDKNNLAQNVRKAQYNEPLKVLIVEDNQVDRKVLESMLTESSQYASLIKSCTNLKEALQILNEYPIDVVILDLNLPDSQGENSLKTLNDKYPNLTIIVNTGAYEEELGLNTLSLGAQDFLIKSKYSAYALNKSLHYGIERKRLEVELKNAYVKLKDTQSQLIEAEKMRVIGGLASGIAHEVKNPLATILYGVNFLEEKLNQDDDKIKMVLKNIKESTNRANNIITDLLDFSHITTLDKKDEDLNVIIEKTLTLINHEFDTNHIKVECFLDRNIPKIKIDKNRVEQVILNLILNSIHAMHKGGTLKFITQKQVVKGNISLAKYQINNASEVVVFQIDDDGCGVPEDKLDKIYEPFFTTRRAKGGVGLGLSVSKSIMDLHDAILDIKNKQTSQGVIATLIFKA